MPVSSAVYTFVVSFLSRYECAVDWMVSEHAPMCFWIPDPSVLFELVFVLYFGLFFGHWAICVVKLVEVHHGDLIYAYISSMVSMI
jgi:hypothetical protein